MAEQQTSFSKLNPIKNGVLVCVDEKTKIFKYIPLDQVIMSDGITLAAFMDDYERSLEAIDARFKRLEEAAGITIDLAVAAAEGVSDDL
jgi:hypothetical protein